MEPKPDPAGMVRYAIVDADGQIMAMVQMPADHVSEWELQPGERLIECEDYEVRGRTHRYHLGEFVLR